MVQAHRILYSSLRIIYILLRVVRSVVIIFLFAQLFGSV